jgi:hypothetical protein
MRIVQILIPNGKREPVLALLDEEYIDYALWEETGRRDFEALVQFPIPLIGVKRLQMSMLATDLPTPCLTIHP